MHPAATASHFCPALALHSPLESQVPAHLLASSALLTATHAPALHVWQAPGQSLRCVQPVHLFVVVSQTAEVPPHWLFFVH